MTALAIDFGHTHTLVARWNLLTNQPEICHFPHLGNELGLIPSVVGQNTIGQPAQDGLIRGEYGQDQLKRLALTGQVEPAQKFWAHLLQAIHALPMHIDRVVLTAPVQAPEPYLRLLESICESGQIPRVVWLDEPIAASVGYGIREDQQLVLVIDFGGGSLDLALVRLHFPDRAQVIAKTGQLIGGIDIDHYLLKELWGRPPARQLPFYLALAERLKISLSTVTETELPYYDIFHHRSGKVTYSRRQLEALLAENGFYQIVQSAVAQILAMALDKGVLKMDIQQIILIGGSSLVPSVQSLIQSLCPWTTIRCNQPLTAVVAGAIATDHYYRHQLQDHLFHSYAIRYWHAGNQTWAYHPLFSKGQPYPTTHPQVIYLQASRPQQTHMDLILGELEDRSSQSAEITWQGERLVAVCSPEPQMVFHQLNTNTIVPLDPVGEMGVDRLRLEFEISKYRELLMTVWDLLLDRPLTVKQVVAKLR